MRVRVFSGPDMKSVMAELRDSLGADAVILSSRQLKSGGGVEVQAAVESTSKRDEKARAAAEEIAHEADFERRLREDLLGVIRTETLRTRSQKRAHASTAVAESAMAAPMRAGREVREDGWVRTGTLGIVSRRIKAPGAITPDPRSAPSKATVRNGSMVEPNDGVSRKPGADEQRLRRTLEFHGVPRLLAADLLRTSRATDSEDATSALAHALDMRLAFDPIAALPRRPVMLIGAPGAGKTVTSAKLAARAVLLGRGVDIISTDTLRAGAREQMESFTSILREPLISISDAADLEAHLTELRESGSKRPCIIDTPGTNPYSRTELKDLRKFVKALDVEPVLVAAAGSDAGELCDIAHIFSTLGVQRMIITRIDAARRLGSIIAAADSAKLNLAQFSMTPYIARGLSTMNPMSLARLLLDEPDGGNPRSDETQIETIEK